MSTVRAYTGGNGDTRFRVTVGRKSARDFKTLEEALRAGIDLALAEDSRLDELIRGRPFDRQVGAVFGGDVRNLYLESLED